MSVEERRRMIVHATLPLVIEHGGGVTTSQIARAAGIGEGTIFRAFKDKDELLDACTAEALRPDHALDAITDIPADLPLADRLLEAAEAMGAHLDRMGALLGALHASGRVRRRDPEPEKSEDEAEKRPKTIPRKMNARSESMTAIHGAIVELLEPDKERLRLPAGQLASLFLSVQFGGRRLVGDAPDTRQIIDVFLHGALKEAA